jgi:acyl-CoA synthetase (AMP-forming)/AMP-acid ligase II
MRPKNFRDVLQAQARQQPDKTAFTYLEHGEREAQRLTFAELEGRAQGVASQLQALAQPGDRALLLYPTGLNFITTFLGCMYAGVIAVPAYPLGKSKSLSHSRLEVRLEAIIRDCAPTVALTEFSEERYRHAVPSQ